MKKFDYPVNHHRQKLSRDYYLSGDTLHLAKNLLGKILFTSKNGDTTGVIITETEAYLGIEDRASHAYNNRRTQRTETMYMQGGTVYVYLCYGIHSLFNIVTGPKNIPHAILIRGGYPYHNKNLILSRRNSSKYHKNLLNGPGKLTSALAITLEDDKTDLITGSIWIEDQGIEISPEDIKITPRIGVDYAGKDALLPYRFVVEEHLFH